MNETGKTIEPSLRMILIRDYLKIVDLRNAGHSWSRIAVLYGRHTSVLFRAWASLQSAIESGKIADPTKRADTSFRTTVPALHPGTSPAPIAKSDNLLRDLVLAKMAESESAPNGKPMLAGRSLDPVDYDDDDMSGAALRARDYAARLLKSKQ